MRSLGKVEGKGAMQKTQQDHSGYHSILKSWRHKLSLTSSPFSSLLAMIGGTDAIGDINSCPHRKEKPKIEKFYVMAPCLVPVTYNQAI